MNKNLRDLATTLQQIIHRLASGEATLYEVLQKNLTPAELEILVQDLSDMGRKAHTIKPVVQARAKGIS